MSPAEFLALALAKVESASIRAWAVDAHNHPIMLALAERAMRAKGTPADNVTRFATFIVCEAMGF